MTDAAPLLDICDVRKAFGGVHAVDGASFALQRGRITGLIGPNGAGKSTLVSLIGGALDLTGGSIAFEGRDLAEVPAYRRAQRGLIRTFQLSSEFSRLTVIENLLVAAPRQKGESLRGALLGRAYWRRQEDALVQQARQMLERFEMNDMEEEYAGNLSGGQKRLVEIMRALMGGPTLLVLDEPMAGINPTLSRRIQGYLLQLRDEGVSMLMVEHELSVVERLCDPVVVMAQGKVIGQGTMRELRARPEVVDAYLAG